MQKKAMVTGLAALLVVAAVGGGIYAWRGSPQEPAAQAGKPGGGGTGGAGGGRRGGGVMPVATALAANGEMAIEVAAIGTVSARNTATVRARVDGLLQRILFREGQKVKVGEVLAEIDPRSFKAALEQAEGQLARDQALLTNAVIDQQRYQMLLARDSASRQQLDTQDALVRQLQGAVQSSRAQVDSARLQLSFTRITAPLAGRLGLRQVDAGNIVRSGDTAGIVVITETQPIHVVFAIPADQLPAVLRRVQAGVSLPVEAWDREGKKKLATGKLLSIDNQIDTATGTVRLKAEFGNEDEKLFPNQFVNARLKVDTRRDAVLIPPAAVQRGTQGTYVYVLDPEAKTVSLRPVTLGAGNAEKVAVDKGLAAGETIVVDGLDKLRPGAKVEPIAPGGATAAAPAEDRSRREGREGGPREEKPAPGAANPPPPRQAPPAAAAAPAPAPTQASAPNPPANAATPAVAGAPVAAEGERPRWMDRVPPEVAEKLKAMTPEERRAWFQKRREERERQATAE